MKTRELGTIDKIILHCADTKISSHFDVHDCRKCHIEEKGFSDIGYHYYIELNGSLKKGRSLQYVGAHCKGENNTSIGVCLEGGKNADGTPWVMPLPQQLETLRSLLKFLGVTFEGATVHGHNEFSPKTCPNFRISNLKFWD